MISHSFPPVEEQLELLMRGVVHLQGSGELEKRLERSRVENKPLKVKAGFDPTVPDLHLGHTVLMTKMRQFQTLGHHVVFLIGDFTAQIGDPSGRNELRPQLSKEQVQEAAQSYAAQAFKILDSHQTELAYNSTWFEKMSASDMIKLSSKYTVARMLERDDFQKRYQDGRAISIHEFLYPLVQAYDSVMLQCDIELGGQDQLFNLLVGRDLMRDHGQVPQMVMTTPLLLGLGAHLEDGELCGDKMSKSKNNYVGITEPAQNIYGKIMSISDDLMWNWYDLLSERSATEINQFKLEVKNGQAHPKAIKELLAQEIVKRFWGDEAAAAAITEFQHVFSDHGVPKDMPFVQCMLGSSLLEAVVMAHLFTSKGEVRRLCSQGGVSLGGEKISDPAWVLPQGEHVLKLGKHKFLRVIVVNGASA